MKTLKRTAILFLALLMAFGSFAGCNAINNSSSTSDNGNNELAIKETENYIIKDSKSDYKIVIADEPRGYEAYAAEELSTFIAQSSSITLPIVKESEVIVNESSKLIILGETELTEQAQITAEKNTYGARGFVIKQKDSNVYLLGGDTRGTLYAVYDFLHYEFGFEVFASNEIAIEKGVTERKLLAFDMSNIPDIPYIQADYEYWGDENRMPGHRMRFNHHPEVFVNATGQPWHNTLDYANPGSRAECECHKDLGINYRDAHPKWYTQSEGEFHYTAHGDKEELQLLEDLIFNRMVFFIERDFNEGKFYEMIGFMQEDHSNTWGQSDAPYDTEEGHVDSVKVLKEKYGSSFAAAMLIHFINPLQERIDNYMEENWDGRKMSITIFAYLDTETAPVKMVGGKAVPIDDSVILHPSSAIFIAPIRANYIHDYGNTGMEGIIDSWKALATNFSFWFYDYYFNTNSMLYLDSTYSLQSYFKAARDAHAQYFFIENPLSIESYYPFGKLKTYLISKLGWDVDLNVQALIDDFFDNYYKDAADKMQEYFNSLTAYFAYIKETTTITGVTGSLGADITGFWKESVVTGWLDIIDEAYESIEMLKYSDKASYDELYNRVLYDSLMPRYILLKHFAKEAFTDETFMQEFNEWKADCAKVGVLRTSGFVVKDLVLTR